MKACIIYIYIYIIHYKVYTSDGNNNLIRYHRKHFIILNCYTTNVTDTDDYLCMQNHDELEGGIG